MRRCSLLLPLAAAISSLALINILKLCLSSAGIVLGNGKSSSRVRSPVCGGTGFLILSMIGPSLKSMIYGDASALKGSPFSLGSWGPRTLVVASDVFVARSECSYEIVTRTKLNMMMTKSRSNTCKLLGRYATTNISSVRACKHECHLTQADEVKYKRRSFRGTKECVIPYARKIEEEGHEVPESESSFGVKVPRPRELELANASTEVRQQCGGQEEGDGVELVQQIVELTRERSSGRFANEHTFRNHAPMR